MSAGLHTPTYGHTVARPRQVAAMNTVPALFCGYKRGAALLLRSPRLNCPLLRSPPYYSTARKSQPNTFIPRRNMSAQIVLPNLQNWVEQRISAQTEHLHEFTSDAREDESQEHGSCCSCSLVFDRAAPLIPTRPGKSRIPPVSKRLRVSPAGQGCRENPA